MILIIQVLYALLEIFFYPKFKNAKINIDTVFEDEILKEASLIQGRVILFYVVYMVLRLYFLAPDKIKHKNEI